MCHVKTHVVKSVYFHLLVDGTRHYVARSERQPLIIFLHELLTIRQAQNTAITSHCLSDEISRVRFLWIVEDCGMELHEFHVLHLSLCTVYHCNTVAGGDVRIGSGGIYGASTASSHNSHFRQVSIDLAGLWVQDISAIALNVGSAACDSDSKMVLCDYLNGKVVFEDFYIRIVSYGLHQSPLDFSPRIVGMVQDAELGMSAFLVQIIGAVLLLVKMDTPLHQFLDSGRCITYNLFYSGRVADIVACHHCVVNMLFEIIDQQVSNRSYTALRLRGVGFFKSRFTNDGNFPFMRPCNFKSVTHSSYS